MDSLISLPRLLKSEQAADMLGVNEQTLAAWRCRRRGPAYVKLGKSIRYSATELQAWIQSRVVTPVGN